MSEIWSLEVKIGGKWESRRTAFTKAAMLAQASLYVSRSLSEQYEVRIVPYVADESRTEILEV
jgi:hypothetical protein